MAQSYLWNHAASERAALFGLDAAVEGDLIYEDYQADNADIFAPASTAGDEPAAGDAGADADADGSEDESSSDEEEAAARRVRHVTAAEAAAKSVPITAVLLPLPAAGVAYPSHAIADVYTRLAAADGVSLHGGQHNVREFSLSAFRGGYRRLLHRLGPRELTWRLRAYEDADADLTRTELAEALTAEGRRAAAPSALPPPSHDALGEDAALNAAAEAGDAAAAAACVHGAGRFTALQLSFALPPSCYATMLIRELLKAPTSAAFHRGIGAHEDVPGAAAPAS